MSPGTAVLLWCDEWPATLEPLHALHHPVGVVSRLSEKNNLAAMALTDVLHSGVKWLLQSSSAAWLLHRENSELTTWKKNASHPELTDVLQFHTVGSRRERWAGCPSKQRIPGLPGSLAGSSGLSAKWHQAAAEWNSTRAMPTIAVGPSQVVKRDELIKLMPKVMGSFRKGSFFCTALSPGSRKETASVALLQAWFLVAERWNGGSQKNKKTKA